MTIGITSSLRMNTERQQTQSAASATPIAIRELSKKYLDPVLGISDSP
jgi:hypothetical protein